MAWITSSTDTGYWLGSTINLTTESSTSGLLWKWKSLLKTAGWYIAASYNGASGAKGEDILTNSLSNIPTSSWFVIVQPGGSRSYCVQRGASDNWRFKYSATGFSMTGSVVSTVPGPLVTGSSFLRRISNTVCGGEIGFIGTGRDDLPTLVTAPLGTLNSSLVCHIAAQNTAPYMFYMVTYQSGSSFLASSSFFLDAMESGSYASEFIQDPYVTYCRARSGGAIEILTAQGITQGGQAQGTAGYASLNNLSASFTEHTYGEFGYNLMAVNPRNGSTAGTGYMIPANAQGTSYQMSGVNSNIYNGSIELFAMPALTDGRFSENSNAGREGGYKGYSQLMRLKGTNRAITGDTLSVAKDGQKDWLAIGDIVFPWFGMVPSGASTDYRAMEAITTTQVMTTHTNWFSGSALFALDDVAFLTTTGGGSETPILFRGRSGGAYVYNFNTPPTGATDIVTIV